MLVTTAMIAPSVQEDAIRLDLTNGTPSFSKELFLVINENLAIDDCALLHRAMNEKSRELASGKDALLRARGQWAAHERPSRLVENIFSLSEDRYSALTGGSTYAA